MLTPFQSIDPAYRRLPAVKQEVDVFAEKLSGFLKNINDNESEEYNKNVFIKFLYDSFYKGQNSINTKGRIDLAVYENEIPIVIFEFKKPKKNDNDMITKNDLNAKAMHQLIKYYFDERTRYNNTNIKYLIVSNALEWFVFDERDFDRVFFSQNKLRKDYDTCERENKNEDYFYKIARSFIEKENPEIDFTYFDLREQKSRDKIRSLYKFFSPQHLLKQPLANDSNSLNKEFYNELLHIIGLEEMKDGGKKLISRMPEKNRDAASLLENVIFNLDRDNRLRKLKNPSAFGESEEEKYFAVALELCITWINRILFLKLLESQLVRYHKDPGYRFLNIETIPDFDALKNLFFSVIAKKQRDRKGRWKEEFKKVPYLNSSLFEPSSLEDDVEGIESLDSNLELEIFKGTKLLDGNKLQKGKLRTLEYLFRFLDSYNFASEGTNEEQEDRKALINASVLGLIFEKINGYKDGSFFTPGFITMYMCKETLRRAVIQKFNEKYDWQCGEFGDLKNHLNDRKNKKDILEFNSVVDDLKICDPAVGSGHFLVSALNELIAVKSDLGILADKAGERLPVTVSVENDELMIMDGERIFEYTAPYGKNKSEIQRTQEALFHEKEKLIEHCLFGVDINGNSVKICRLRLWIELLKNTYYILPEKHIEQDGSSELELQTLPNIDINIKRGNSLISRFSLDDDLSAALKKSKWTIDTYKIAVERYRNAKTKEEKWAMRDLIDEIKTNFASEISTNNKLYKAWVIARRKLYDLTTQFSFFEMDKKEKRSFDERVNKLSGEVKQYEQKIQDIKDNKIYRSSFEWRFEFPEVMDEDGNFVGFDVVIGNPPYINLSNLGEEQRQFFKEEYKVCKNKSDLYAFFIERGMAIKNSTGLITFIIPHTWVSTSSFEPLRKLLLKKLHLNKLVELGFGIFKDAYVKTVIVFSDLEEEKNLNIIDVAFKNKISIPKINIFADAEMKINLDWTRDKQRVFDKIFKNSVLLDSIIHFTRGIKTSDDKRFISVNKTNDEYKKIIRGRNIKAYSINYDKEYILYRPDFMKEKAGSLPHTKELFEAKEKLISQRVNSSGQLLVTYDDEQYYCLDTTNVSTEIKDKNYSLKYLLAVINSKLINWWFNDVFKMPTISGYELQQIPVKKIDKREQQSFIVLAEKILRAKKKNPDIDTSDLEKKIDEKVYQLYELTEEEIKIVENT